MPELGFGRLVAFIAPQVLPSSFDQHSVTTFWRLRQRIWRRLFGWNKTVGWMAPNSCAELSGPVFVQVSPRSGVRSRWTRQPSCSVLEGQSNVPSANHTGLFLIGPRMPSGSRRGAVHVGPPSAELIIMPHQRDGFGPTL